MAVGLFMIFLAVLFFGALFFILVNIVLIVVWNVRKHRGKMPKKKWLVIPVVFLVINILVALLPIAYISFLRDGNQDYLKEIIYAESGTMLFWPVEEGESINARFEMDGIKYVRFLEDPSTEWYIMYISAERYGTPIANIKDDPSTSDAVNNFMTNLLTGSTADELNTLTVYPVSNDNNFPFYFVDGNAIGAVYCPEEQFDALKAYYSDFTNYNTQNPASEYLVFPERGTSNAGDDTTGYLPNVRIEEKVTIAPGAFEEMHQLYYSGQEAIGVSVPQTDKDRKNAAAPGSPVHGYEERTLYAYSTDKLAHFAIHLALIEDQIYVRLRGGDDPTGYPLPEALNQHIKEAVFGV